MNFLSAKETAKKMGVHLSTLANLRMVGKGPPFIKVGWGIIYDPFEVEKYIKENNHAKRKKNTSANKR